MNKKEILDKEAIYHYCYDKPLVPLMNFLFANYHGDYIIVNMIIIDKFIKQDNHIFKVSDGEEDKCVTVNSSIYWECNIGDMCYIVKEDNLILGCFPRSDYELDKELYPVFQQNTELETSPRVQEKIKEKIRVIKEERKNSAHTGLAIIALFIIAFLFMSAVELGNKMALEDTDNIFFKIDVIEENYNYVIPEGSEIIKYYPNGLNSEELDVRLIKVQDCLGNKDEIIEVESIKESASYKIKFVQSFYQDRLIKESYELISGKSSKMTAIENKVKSYNVKYKYLEDHSNETIKTYHYCPNGIGGTYIVLKYDTKDNTKLIGVENIYNVGIYDEGYLSYLRRQVPNS